MLNLIPLAALAAILLHTGWKLAHPSILKGHIRLGRSQWIPYVVTVLAILFTDLLVGIGVGMTVGIFIILRDTLLNPPFTVVSPKGAVLQRWQLHDHVNFLNKAALLNELEALEPGARVEIDGRMVRRFDTDALEVLHQFVDTAQLRNIDYRLVAIPPRPLGAGAH
jgi:SulP family sulfate permease